MMISNLYDQPRKFSWRYEVAPDVALKLDSHHAQLSYRIQNVHADVVFTAPPQDLHIQNFQGKNALLNPFTKKNWFEAIAKQFGQRSKTHSGVSWIKVWRQFANGSLSTTYGSPTEPLPINGTSWLVLWPAHQRDATADILVLDPHTIQVTPVQGTKRSVSFDPSQASDITIDPAAWRTYADHTRQ